MANKYQHVMENLGAVNSNSATLAQLSDIETRLGCSLPSDYHEFLLDYGDSSFVVDTAIVYPYTKNGYATLGSVSDFYGASNRDSDIAERYRLSLEYQDIEDIEDIDYYLGVSLLHSIEDIQEIGWPEELLPIGCDAGGNTICLALFGLRPGSIFYWMNCPSLNGYSPYLIADSFDEFMHLLQHDEA